MNITTCKLVLLTIKWNKPRVLISIHGLASILTHVRDKITTKLSTSSNKFVYYLKTPNMLKILLNKNKIERDEF